MPSLKQIQLGKNGITENFISTLKSQFQNCQNVKVSVLKSCCRDKKELKSISEQILNELGNNYTARIIGYTLNIKKWRSARR